MFKTIRSGKHALLLAEAVEIVVGENPASPLVFSMTQLHKGSGSL